MSKIKNITINTNLMNVILESGTSNSINIEIRNNLKELLNIEIFDQKSIDEKLKEMNMDKATTFNLSKFFSKLGAKEMEKTLKEYIGIKLEPKTKKTINIEEYYTITDLIETIIKNNNQVTIIGTDNIIEEMFD